MYCLMGCKVRPRPAGLMPAGYTAFGSRISDVGVAAVSVVLALLTLLATLLLGQLLGFHIQLCT
jgi:hypothetical protein